LRLPQLVCGAGTVVANIGAALRLPTIVCGVGTVEDKSWAGRCVSSLLKY
jgi:hypothetical protein